MQTNNEQHNKPMKVIFGTMGVAGGLDHDNTSLVLDLFSKEGYSEVDTALMYQAGKTEQLLGDLKICDDKRFQVATKINPWVKGGMTKQSVGDQIKSCLKHLQAEKVDLLYLHAPDHNTPIMETLEALHEDNKEYFVEWGLSNYAAWQVVDIYHVCISKGWKTPTVYQGMYNYVTRDIEKELIPAIRRCGMRFYAYNPLAGGILTGRYNYDDDPNSGRFSNTTVWGKKYRERFWHEPIFHSLEKLKELGKQHDISLVAMAQQWLMHHSLLSTKHGDGVIIGGSSVDHIQSNLAVSAINDPLPDEIIEAMNEAWEVSKSNCQQYFR